MKKKYLIIIGIICASVATFLAIFLPLNLKKTNNGASITKQGGLVKLDGSSLSWDDLINETSESDDSKNKIIVEDNSVTYVDPKLTGELTLPNEITVIGKKAFQYSELTNVNFENVEVIGVDAFLESKITSITFPTTLRKIEMDAFYNCRELESVEFNNGLETIGYNAFYNCSFKTLSIPASVTSLEEGAFIDCKQITGTVTIPSNVTIIKNSVFKGCTGISEFILGSVTKIEFQAFYNCTSLNKINFPSSLTEIGDYAFRDCASLESIDLSALINLKKIGEGAFEGCRGVTSISLNEGLESLGKAVFSNCISLNKITIPESITNIPDSCFYGDSMLETINIPSSIERIGLDAFYGCLKLMVTLDENTAYIAINGSDSSIKEEITSKEDFMFYALKHYYIERVKDDSNENN